MGDTLAKPVTEKHTSSFDTDFMHIAAAGMQGWRKKMEDAHTAEFHIRGDRRRGFIAVFDGHNGQAVAKHASLHLLAKVLEQPEYGAENYEAALKSAFLQLDADVERDPVLREDGGCTATSVLLTPNEIYCANLGDSRTVLCRGGKAEALSVDHRPTVQSERERVEAAGGSIDRGRVNGTLSLTRALGDFDFKADKTRGPTEQLIIALPDVKRACVTDDVEFIVCACDGVYDVMSNEELVDFVRHGLHETGGDAALVCERILDDCLAKVPHGLGTDNMTIVIMLLKPAFFSRK